MAKFGEWLRNELENKKISQTELAYQIGVTPAQVSRIISGERSTTNDTLTAIAHALKISPITLFRQAGLLPNNNGSDIKLEDWEYLLKQMTPEDEAELRQIAEMKIERRKKDQAIKTLKPKKVG
jgi:transcriptional regulator with XRE-family HTH domain